jgi:centromere protein C
LKEVVTNGIGITSKQTNEVESPVHQSDITGVETEQGERESAIGQASEKAEQPFESTSEEHASPVPSEGAFQNPMGNDELEDFLSEIDNTIQNAAPVSDAASKTAPIAAEKAIDSIEPAQRTDFSQKPARQRKTGRKRKSDELEDESAANSAKKPAKEPRATKAEAPKRKAKQKVASVMSHEFAPRQAALQQAQESTPARLPGMTKDPNTHLSQRQQAELDQIIEKVKARPGKLKTLYVLKREKSKKSGADDVRAGRTVVKPLAYWSAEQCVYNEGAAGLELGSRIPLSSVKEITNDAKKGHSKQDSDDAASLNDYHEDGHEEPWEKQIGVFRGQASVWSQPDQTTLEDPEETDLAYHPSSMLTREVKGSGFKFAKLVSTPFFGSGIVDLPPGAVKKPKNSRTMHMCFFVFQGRVTVKIGQGIEEGECERFSIGKGGVFQVPRGELRSCREVDDEYYVG